MSLWLLGLLWLAPPGPPLLETAPAEVGGRWPAGEPQPVAAALAVVPEAALEPPAETGPDALPEVAGEGEAALEAEAPDVSAGGAAVASAGGEAPADGPPPDRPAGPEPVAAPEPADEELPIALVGLPDSYQTAFRRAMRRTGLRLRLIEVTDEPAPDLTGCRAIYLSRGTDLTREDWRRAVAAANQTGAKVVSLFARAIRAPGLELAPEPEQTAARAYFEFPTVDNLSRFLRRCARVDLGRDQPLEPPLEFPKSAIYHPDAPAPFTDLTTYHAWRPPDPAKPTVLAPFPQVHLFAGDTALIDAVIRRCEPFANVLAVYGAAPPEARADLVIALWPTQLFWDSLQLQEHDAPILQGIRFMEGDRAVWEAGRGLRGGAQLTVWVTGPEVAGVVGSQVIGWSAPGPDGPESLPFADQIDLLARRAERWLKLRTTPNEAKRLAIVHHGSAAYLNVPRSLTLALEQLHAAGYDTGRPLAEAELTRRLDAAAWPEQDAAALRRLAAAEDVARWPLAAYRAWFAHLPQELRDAVTNYWGGAEVGLPVVDQQILIPAVQCGRITLARLPGRADPANQEAALHSLAIPPRPLYLAFYAWLRHGLDPTALVHWGTHGSVEFTPRNGVALGPRDWPTALLDDLPFVYPYMINNPQEAITARRRAGAVTVSHNVPTLGFTPLTPDLERLQAAVEGYLSAEGEAVKAAHLARLTELTRNATLVPEEVRRQAGAELAEAASEWLHELFHERAPLGLHTFGVQPTGRDLADTLLAVATERLLAAAGGAATADRLVAALAAGADAEGALSAAGLTATAELLAVLTDLVTYRQRLTESDEWGAFLTALSGRFIPSATGGDPVRQPELLPTGRNLHGLDPTKVPSPAAWEVGRRLGQELLAQHLQRVGKFPERLGYVLFGGETIRHQGVMEAQILWLLGVEPVWTPAGRVVGVKVIAREQLGRPRIDVLVTCTGQYRDVFADCLRLLQQAVDQAAASDEIDNAVARGGREIAARLQARGLTEEVARRRSLARVFAPTAGVYSAIETPAGRLDTNRDSARLARVYVERLGFAYGRDETWGDAGPEVLKAAAAGLDAVVFSRSTHLYGLLDTDHPYGFVGGLGLAARQAGGRPEYYVNNLRASDGAEARVETIGHMATREAQARYLNATWIRAMQAEGYAGAHEFENWLVNLTGWNATAPEALPRGLWREAYEVYVNDRHGLGLPAWLRQVRPGVWREIRARLTAAGERGWWDATPAEMARLEGPAATRQPTGGGLAPSLDAATEGRRPAAGVSRPLAVPAPSRHLSAATPIVRGRRLVEQRPARLPVEPARPLPLGWRLTLVIVLFAAAGRRYRREVSGT